MSIQEMQQELTSLRTRLTRYRNQSLSADDDTPRVLDDSELARIHEYEQTITTLEARINQIISRQQTTQLSTAPVAEPTDTVLSIEQKIEKWLDENKLMVKDHFTSLALFSGNSLLSPQNKYDTIISDIRSSDDCFFSVPIRTMETYIDRWAKKNNINTNTLQENLTKNVIDDAAKLELLENWLNNERLDIILKFDILNAKNDAQIILNFIEETTDNAIKAVPGLKEMSVDMVKASTEEWMSKNIPGAKTKMESPAVKTASDFEKLFAKIKKLGKFEWKFAGDKLQLKIEGPSASFAYKPSDDTKVELSADTSSVNLKAETKIDNVKLDAKVSTDYEGKVKIAAGIKIEELFDFNGSAGSAALTVKGDSKSWSVDLTLASSNGSQAHLSQKAAEKLQETIREATDAVSELYNILETKDINSDNFSEIKNQAKKQWEKVNTAISALDNVAKTPVGKSEIFISFGIKGDENSTSGNIGLTVTF
jgi:hypothetical protein